MFGAGLNCKSVVYGSGEENSGDFIGTNERLFSKSGSENIGFQEDNAPNKLLAYNDYVCLNSMKSASISKATILRL
ncbi:MAG: hypothetical protein AAF847_07655 [Bacteroidota bacterium]